jgi:hypothetical protein
VRVEGLEKRWRFATRPEPVALEYKDHMLVPYVVGVVVGGELRVSSRDVCCYNLHWMGKRNTVRWTNITLKQDDCVEFGTFAQPESAWFKDDMHGWIKAWVHVLPHPVFAVTDDSGRFALPKLPPGDYEVAVWHERWKAAPQRVVLAAEHAERRHAVGPSWRPSRVRAAGTRRGARGGAPGARALLGLLRRRRAADRIRAGPGLQRRERQLRPDDLRRARIARGARYFLLLAVHAPGQRPATPCGACRQVLAEFNPRLRVLLGCDGDEVMVTTLDELLPEPFLFRRETPSA